MTKRATCSRSKRPKGKIGFCGSATPGAWFIEASRALSSASCPGRIGARTMKLDCGVIALPSGPELQREVDQPLLGPIDLAEIEARPDQADLVADPVGDQRGLGIVQHDAF